MKKNLRTLFCILLIAGFCSVSMASTNSVRPKVAAFQLKDMKGKKINSKKLEGKVVLVSFWATWCVPCKRELDDLAKIYKEHHKDGLEVIAIATDGPETFSDIRGVVKRHRWPFRVFPDKEGEVMSILNPRGTVPYSIYVDRSGRQAYDHEGYSQGDAKKMTSRIKKLLVENKEK